MGIRHYPLQNAHVQFPSSFRSSSKMWTGQPKEGSSHTSKTVHGEDTGRNLSQVWDTFSQAKTTLRHIENKLEAAPSSTVVCDTVMSSKKTPVSAMRKVSRKDGRYQEDSSGSAPASKLLSSHVKTHREKSSRSPLRVTTIESNVKKSNRVEFRDPLASYRETYSASSYMSPSHSEAKALLAGVESAKAESTIHPVSNRDVQEFDSTRSSALDETVVRYLNDRPAIDALQSSEYVFRGASPARTGTRPPDAAWSGNVVGTQETGPRNLGVSETPQSSVSSTGSHRLEILRRRQPDAKLEKLKERIRKQWEHSEEAGSRNVYLDHTEQPILVNNTECTVTTAKVRKVAIAPPAPAYKGFNPTETKIRTPDGKVWPEAEFHNISRELYQDLALKDCATAKEKATDKCRDKKSARPVRKVQRVARGLSPDVKSGRGQIISTSSWRDGQKLVKKILGPPPKLERGRAESNDRGSRERTGIAAGPIGREESCTRPEVSAKDHTRSSERLWSNVHSDRSQIKPELMVTSEIPERESQEQVNTDFLPMEIRGILDDLQLDSGHREARQEGTRQCHQSGRSKSPTKRKPEKAAVGEEPQVTSKKRHYDSEQMRQYILRQQEERKKKQNEERMAQKEAKEQKTKRLQELYKKQKEAFSKSKNMSAPEHSAASRLQETYTKLIMEQTWLKEPASQGVQPLSRPGYQPSGESDKENKGQDRPLSASSSSDLSLSEPQSFGRSNLMDPTWMQPDRLSPKSSLLPTQSSRFSLFPPQTESGAFQTTPGAPTLDAGGLFSRLLTLEQIGFLRKDVDSVLSTKKQISYSAGGALSLPVQTYTSSGTSQNDPVAIPSTSQYQRKLDRIEALKATAASLSNRVESEARQLACGSINYSTAWNSKLDVLRPSQEEERWAKPVSPPVRDRCEDAFSTRIQKMLDTCVSHATFDADLPGVGNLHEFKKLPQTIRPHSAVTGLGIRSLGGHRDEEIPTLQSQKHLDPPNKEFTHTSPEHQVVSSHDSSAGSISEGPLLSEGTISESEGTPLDHSPQNMAEALKGRGFCVAEGPLYGPMKEFQKDVENYLPLPPKAWSLAQEDNLWEGLAKGSPHSVINIYAKSFRYGKGIDEQSDAASPVLQPLLPATSFQDSLSYDDDFASSQGSATLTDGQLATDPSVGSSNSSVAEELSSRTSPSQNLQTGRPRTSSHTSSKKRTRAERLESHSGSHPRPGDPIRTAQRADGLSQQEGKALKNRTASPARDYDLNHETDSTLEDLSARSFASLSSDTGRSQRTTPAPLQPSSQTSFHSDSPENNVGQSSSPGGVPSSAAGLQGVNNTSAFPNTNVLPDSLGPAIAKGPMRFSPAALQHRMAAELNYLSTIEESVRQLSDVERVRGISLAQQETVSLAQILKAQKQLHERDMTLLKFKAEQEAQESQRQLDESRQKAVQAHADTLQQLVQSRQETAEQLQIATSKIAEQQVEAARLTTDAARQIREVTELAHSRMSEAVGVPAAPITTLFDRERQQHSEFMKQLRARVDTHRAEAKSHSQSADAGGPMVDSGDFDQRYSPSIDSYSESSRSKNHDQSTSSSRQESPSVPSSKEKEMKVPQKENLDHSIEEAVHTAEDDSLRSESVPSLAEERDTTSIATEYSLKFDESMTEDEIEEKSFRSLLPSESHRRFNLEKRRGIRDDSDEEASPQKIALSAVKDLSLPFSEGQDSFSKFTMEMVRQYMKEEEMRAAHQSSLLRLRQRALKEKTKAELAWLEHQKKRLRDKGEDDKMPPIRKRQRGLLLRLQLEQAEIKRLQDASKAARKERQLILKQQEEIERIRQTTMKLQEKLKSAGEGKQDISSDADMKISSASSPVRSNQQSRSASPVSISGSETSSIMQKLKKMRSRMDEKFLTKREQKLMQRRQHAEELLEWKRRLDVEEAEIQRIEKQALVVWDRERPKPNTSWREQEEPMCEGKGSERESPAPCSPHLHSESSVPEELVSLPVESIHDGRENLEESAITEDLASSHKSTPRSATNKPSLPKSRSSSNMKIISSRDGIKGHLGTRPQHLSQSWSEDSLSMTQSETTSDQSDIESRIRALKDELKKRKSVVDQLKKEQKKRQKERLKAQEASLIKQLESYDEFIKRTEAELSRDLEATPSAKPQIKTPSSTTEKLKLKAHQLQRPDAVKTWKTLSESERSRASLESINEHIISLSPDSIQSASLKRVPDAEVCSRTPSPKSPVKDTLDSLPSSPVLTERGRAIGRPEEVSGDESVVSSQRSDIPEEVIESEAEDTDHVISLKLDSALQLDLGQSRPSGLASKDKLTKENGSLGIHIDLGAESLHTGQEKLEKCVHEYQNGASEGHPHTLSKLAEEPEGPHSGQSSFRREPSYSEDFEVSSPRKLASVEGTPRAETYRDDFESSSAMSARKEFSSEDIPVSEREVSQHTKDPRRRSCSLESDEDISEHVSGKSLSLSGSIHSERLLLLISTSEVQEKDQHEPNIEVDRVTSHVPPLSLEADSFLNFQLGDRVLVSNVQPGTLRFMGGTHFAEGLWAGVELDKPEGNNDGTYNGTKYFDCEEKHGIFAPPHKIFHFTTDFEVITEVKDDSFLDVDTNLQLEQEWKDQEEHKTVREEHDQTPKVKTPVVEQAGITLSATSLSESTDTVSRSKESSIIESLADVQLCHDQSPSSSPDHTNQRIAKHDLSAEVLETSGVPITLDNHSGAPYLGVQSQEVETFTTPLLNLLTQEKPQIEPRSPIPSSEERVSEVGNQVEKVSLLTESLLQNYVKDTVRQLQEIQKARHKKIHLSNLALHRKEAPQREESMPRGPPSYLQEPEDTTTALQNLFLNSELEDEREEASSPDLYPRPDSPVFGASGQEELTKRLSELELQQEFLNVIEDEQDWFDEDFGISSRKVLPKQPEAPLPKVEPSIVKASEEPILVVPHTIPEVEGFVCTATEELWKWKQQGHDLQSISLPSDFLDSSSKGDDLESISRQVYKKAVFDLTREIFGEVFAEDPNLQQPVWMKPYRTTSLYYRRVKNPNNLEAIKTFLTAEVLKLCSLKKEPNIKTDWQKMMKFGRKKRDRVDHILVQELHEEEAQWVNYDEDELCVKMQLADGIFEALLRDTVRVLHEIQEKQIKSLLV
ncbi:centrosome-associated protein 350 isoform X2 [Ambystoma mexicanum]|uniref:centrosome-associated protein 350 isoform X2 n=1 Tax=Ambystoma mexicanum TaxID=8296 RepID=UPI0037E75753